MRGRRGESTESLILLSEGVIGHLVVFTDLFLGLGALSRDKEKDVVSQDASECFSSFVCLKKACVVHLLTFLDAVIGLDF